MKYKKIYETIAFKNWCNFTYFQYTGNTSVSKANINIKYRRSDNMI